MCAEHISVVETLRARMAQDHNTNFSKFLYISTPYPQSLRGGNFVGSVIHSTISSWDSIHTCGSRLSILIESHANHSFMGGIDVLLSLSFLRPVVLAVVVF